MTQVRCRIDSIRIAEACPDELTLILKREGEGSTYLPIWIDQHQAQILADELHGKPDSKKELDSFLTDSGATDSAIGCTTVYLKGDAFFAKVLLSPHTIPREVGCSIGVALALAVRDNAPILVDDALFDRAGVDLK